MDLITYIPSLSAFHVEAKAIIKDEEHPLRNHFIVDDGDVTFSVSKIPVHYTGNGSSVCLVRGINRSQLDAMDSIEVLGECVNKDYVFDSDEAQAKYESVYDVTPRTLTDEDGNTYEYTPPYKIGVFA